MLWIPLFYFFVKYQFSCFSSLQSNHEMHKYVTRNDMSKYQKPRNKMSTKISLSVYPRKLITDDTTGLHNNSKVVLHVVINLYFTAAFLNMGVLRATTVLILIAVQLFACVAIDICYAPKSQLYYGSECRYVWYYGDSQLHLYETSTHINMV